MTDRTDEMLEAFDQVREWDRSDRDDRIDDELARSEKLTGSLADEPAARDG